MFKMITDAQVATPSATTVRQVKKNRENGDNEHCYR
jgi:hypothetical protein